MPIPAVTGRTRSRRHAGVTRQPGPQPSNPLDRQRRRQPANTAASLPKTSVASAATMPGVPSGSTTTSLSTPCRRRNDNARNCSPYNGWRAISYRDLARQHRAKLLQSVACAVGA
ncbi:hypothetical protein I546_7196, partial [Mycobacterium kansasii 732]